VQTVLHFFQRLLTRHRILRFIISKANFLKHFLGGGGSLLELTCLRAIPSIDLPILLREICGPILGIYLNRSQTQNVEIRTETAQFPEKGIRKWDFRCSAGKEKDTTMSLRLRGYATTRNRTYIRRPQGRRVRQGRPLCRQGWRQDHPPPPPPPRGGRGAEQRHSCCWPSFFSF
jgi:hypothetical protein